MDNHIEEIKSKIDIVEFIGSYITVKKMGRNYKANCPFHNEKTPSFVISPDRQIWHCFGSCGDGGDVIKFFMKWESITFFEALKDLAQRTGVKLDSVNFEDQAWKRKERLLQINNLANDFFHYLLTKNKIGGKAREYLVGRHINDGLIRTFSLGYAPSSWDSLLNFLKKKQFAEEEMYEAGLIIKNDAGHFYDRFRGRLMFPIKDVRGNIIGFSGRLLESKPSSVKYVNTPESPIYHKRESLFGIHLAKDAIKKQNNAILVEGEFDMILPYSKGIENVVAIKGSAVTLEQLAILKKYTTQVTLALDTDAAGEEAVRRGINNAEKMDFEIYVVQFSAGKDPDEAIRKDIGSFKKEIASPLPIYDFILESTTTKHPGDDPFSKKKIAEEIAPYLTHIQNPIVFSHYIKKVSSQLGVTPESMEKLIWKERKKAKPINSFRIRNKAPETETKNPEEQVQRFLMSVILQSENAYQLSDRVFSQITLDDFSVPAFKKLVQHFLKYKTDNQTEYQAKTFFDTLPSELKPISDEVYLSATVYDTHDLENIDKAVDDSVIRLKEFSKRRKMTDGLQ